MVFVPHYVMNAIHRDDVAPVKQWLSAPGSDIDAFDDARANPYTMLMLAVEKGSARGLECARYLIQQGANVNVVQPTPQVPIFGKDYQMTALHVTATAFRRQREVVELLLKAGDNLC